MTDTRWTIAYRNPRANRFLRVDLALEWDQAMNLGNYAATCNPHVQVFVTTTAAADASDYVCAEDKGNILVASGRRVRVLDGGDLAYLIPETSDVPPVKEETTDDALDLSVCQDCVLLLANGGCDGCESCAFSATPEQEPCRTVADRMVGVWGEDARSITLGGEELGFSWSSCDGCGSTLGGDRFRAYVL